MDPVTIVSFPVALPSFDFWDRYVLEVATSLCCLCTALQRAELTRLLIQQRGFTAVLAESDWPDAFRWAGPAGPDGLLHAGRTGCARTPCPTCSSFTLSVIGCSPAHCAQHCN